MSNDEAGKAAFAAAAGVVAEAAPANELRRYVDEAHEQWIEVAAKAPPISGKRYKQLSVFAALGAEDATWMFKWASRGVTAIHVRDEDGNWIGALPAPEAFDSLPVEALRVIFRDLGMRLFLSPLPTNSY